MSQALLDWKESQSRHWSRPYGEVSIYHSPAEARTHNLGFFFGPGRALGLGPSTPAPRALFDPVLGLDAMAAVFPLVSLVAG